MCDRLAPCTLHLAPCTLHRLLVQATIEPLKQDTETLQKGRQTMKTKYLAAAVTCAASMCVPFAGTAVASPLTAGPPR